MLDFCGIFPYGAGQLHGSAVLPLDLYGLSEPLIFQKKLIQTFHVPTLFDGANILPKSSTTCTKNTLQCRTTPCSTVPPLALDRTAPISSVNYKLTVLVASVDSDHTKCEVAHLVILQII